MTVLNAKVAAVASKTPDFAAMEGERPILDFFKEIFSQLLPLLIGCFGVVGAAKQLNSPGFIARRKLRTVTNDALRGHPKRAEFTRSIEAAVWDVGATTTEDEVAAMANEIENQFTIAV